MRTCSTDEYGKPSKSTPGSNKTAVTATPPTATRRMSLLNEVYESKKAKSDLNCKPVSKYNPIFIHNIIAPSHTSHSGHYESNPAPGHTRGSVPPSSKTVCPFQFIQYFGLSSIFDVVDYESAQSPLPVRL
jgi:hypothetical protein